MQARLVRTVTADTAAVTDRLVEQLAAEHRRALAGRSSVDSQFRVVRTPSRVVYTRTLISGTTSSRNVLTVDRKAGTARLRSVDRQGNQEIRTSLSLRGGPDGTKVTVATTLPEKLASPILNQLLSAIDGLAR